MRPLGVRRSGLLVTWLGAAALAFVAVMIYSFLGSGTSAPTQATSKRVVATARPDAHVHPSALAGTIVHFFWTDMEDRPGQHDPYNGVTTLNETWARYDANGLEDLNLTRGWTPDGTLIGVLRQDTTSELRYGQYPQGPTPRAIPGLPAPPPPGCVERAPAAAELVQRGYPDFFDVAKLELDGEAPGGAFRFAIPGVAARITATPLRVYASTATPQFFHSSSQTGDGVHTTEHLAIDQVTGRGLADTWTKDDAQGRLVEQGSNIMGDLEVYAASAVPASVWQLTQIPVCLAGS